MEEMTNVMEQVPVEAAVEAVDNIAQVAGNANGKYIAGGMAIGAVLTTALIGVAKLVYNKMQAKKADVETDEEAEELEAEDVTFTIPDEGYTEE